MVLGGCVEVGAHPVAQVDRLAHIDNAPVGVLHQVAAGFFREGIQDLLDMIVPFHNEFILTHWGRWGESVFYSIKIR